MIKYFLLVFLQLVTIYGIGQTSKEDELLEKLHSTMHDTLQASIYMDLHNSVFKTDLPKARHYASKILEHGVKGNSKLFMQRGYIGLARCERRLRNYEKIYELNEKSIEIARQIGHQGNLFSALLLQARDYLDDDKPNKSLPYIEECQLLLPSLEKTYQAKFDQTYGYYFAKLSNYQKANEYYYKTIATYATLGNEHMVAENKYLISLNLIKLRETDKIPGIIYEAINTYKKINSLGRQADCFALLGQAYLLNGNGKKGIEVFNEVLELYKKSQDKVQQGLSYIELGRSYLLEKDLDRAEQNGKMAENILMDLKYEYGIVSVYTFWGQYFAERNEFAKAEEYFKKADKLAVGEELKELKIENEKYWAQSRYKNKNFKGGDSLLYSYAKQLLQHENKVTIQKDLGKILLKNKELHPATTQMLKMLYSPGGAEKIQLAIGDQNLADYYPIDSIMELNPYSLASAGYDSNVMIADNKHLIEQEVKYKTRLMADSLVIAKQNDALNMASLRNRNMILIAFLAGIVVLGAGLYLQYKNRKRAEGDKAKIELLQDEIHHRVKNNLGVIRRLIDVAGKETASSISLQTLQSRVTAIELLHKRLYNDKMIGNISLQEYLLEITQAIKTTFDSEKNIDIAVNTPITLSGKAAEKIGLITNELVTNSYKYAFNNHSAGSIHISAIKTSAGQYELQITDNGIGMNEGVAKNYGMKLIAGLSAELNGQFSFKNKNGTAFTLNFPDNN